MQQSLFGTNPRSVPNATIQYLEGVFSPEIATEFFNELLHKTPWQEDEIVFFGKRYKQPRLTALYGNKSYSYSNITMHPIPFTETLLEIKSKVEEIVEQEFNVCLLNLYRNGNDSNGWHSDNEQSLGKNPTIASISLGATRKFNLKHNDLKDEKLSFDLTHNSLFVMRGETQHFWKHQIPKTKKKVSERINLTFRIIK